MVTDDVFQGTFVNGDNIVLLILDPADIERKFSKTISENLTVEEMKKIAQTMTDFLLEHGYWDILQTAVEEVVKNAIELECPKCGRTSIIQIATTYTKLMLGVTPIGTEETISESEMRTSYGDYKCDCCNYESDDFDEFVVRGKEALKARR